MKVVCHNLKLMEKRSKNVQFEGKWEGANKQVEVKLSLIVFEDCGSKIVYCPALDVYGYGSTEEEALDSFKICLGEFLKYTINKGTLHSEMVKMGWTIKKKKFTPPLFSKLLKANETFSNIFNNHDFKKIDQNINIPAFA